MFPIMFLLFANPFFRPPPPSPYLIHSFFPSPISCSYSLLLLKRGRGNGRSWGGVRGGERLLNLAEPRRRKSRKCVTGTGNRITGAQEHVPECREKRSTTFTSSFSHLVGYSGVKNGRILICFALSFFTLSLFFSLSPCLSLHLFSKS